MFGEMRQVLGIPKTTDILEHIDTLPDDEQKKALESIRAIEREAMKSQTPQPGLMTLMAYLDANSIPKAICTRNFEVPVQNLLEKFLEGSRFHPVITRDFRPPKPDLPLASCTLPRTGACRTGPARETPADSSWWATPSMT
ncbi:hypothetical protein NW754_009718 [Fusarium falciforme]|nr:hypothetical protein NW754_009718 [Fusarium falciforme]